MLELDGKTIRITREDTAIITLRLSGDTIPAGTRVLATLKAEASKASVPIWEKWLPLDGTTATLTLYSDDTDIEPGTYWWDIRLVLDTGEVRTPFAPQKFEVMKVVGNIY